MFSPGFPFTVLGNLISKKRSDAELPLLLRTSLIWIPLFANGHLCMPRDNQLAGLFGLVVAGDGVGSFDGLYGEWLEDLADLGGVVDG